ncbi:MAG: hypothetical protein A3F42_08280 [Gammaproteobacteria bacterium RIFCSPHIGHO2_12_FULL_37_34]|nr:MAG: hypothetical protein A3F42_08280 [Gammaproteobacteria bacterium RIFCSPHIGHO2_12_FULL_37_34]
MTKQDALVAVFTRNAFYKRLYYLVLLTFVLSIAVIVILIGTVIFLIKNPTQPLYFASDAIGQLIQDVPVNQPNMSPEALTAWVVEAVQSANSYNYINYRSQLQNAQKYFTNYGWQNYLDALTASQNLLSVTKLNLIMLAKVVSPPSLVTQGILSGAYAWRFKMPILLTAWSPPYSDRSKSITPFIITVIVQRQPILQSYKGLGIVQYISETAMTTQPAEISLTPTG